MMSKIALLLLAVLILAGAIAKWRRPEAPKRNAIEPARKCAECGTFIVGAGPCPCLAADGPNR